MGPQCGRTMRALVLWVSLLPFTLRYDCHRQSCEILIRCAEHHPLGFVLAEKGDGLPAARRLASPAGGGKALAVTERAFSPHSIPRCCPLSRLRRQLSQRESQVGGFWLGAYVSGGFAIPHPSRLRRATFPPGEGFLGRWNSVGAEENPRWRRGHTHERYVSFPQLIEP